MEKTKLEIMKEIKVKLEDIHNSQASLIEKIAHVITELFNSPDKELETQLNELHTNASNNAELAKKTTEDYTMRINKIENES